MVARLTGNEHRVWPLRLLKGAIVFLTLCVLAAGAGYAYLRHQLGKIDRLTIPGLDESGEVMNVLLVGSDSREDVTGDLAETTGKGQVSGQRSDTMMVLHVDPKQSKAAIFSIPRDLYLPISGTDYSDRVNTAFSVAGAPGLIATIEEALGFPINHYVEIDFTGFRDIVNAVGGVKVYFPSPVRDEVSGLAVEDPGCVKLDGDAGLAFVRSRNFETYESGELAVRPHRRPGSHPAPAGLHPAHAAQGGVVRAEQPHHPQPPGWDRRARRQARRPDEHGRHRPPGPPLQVPRRRHRRHAHLPHRAGRHRRGGGAAAQGGGGRSPTSTASTASRSPDDAAAATSRPSDIRVRILNGYGADGVAGEAAVDLTAVGFNVADRGDADSYNYSATVIRYATGAEAKAAVLNQFVDGGAVIEEDSSLRTVDVTLVLGSDYTGIVNQATIGTDTTGTTAPAADPDPSSPSKGAAAGPSC